MATNKTEVSLIKLGTQTYDPPILVFTGSFSDALDFVDLFEQSAPLNKVNTPGVSQHGAPYLVIVATPLAYFQMMNGTLGNPGAKMLAFEPRHV